MGVRLVGMTYHPHWSQTLTYAEARALGAMALSALDNTQGDRPADLYFGGEEALVLALDGDLPDVGTATYRTRTKAVQTIVKRLLEVRAIERVTEGRRGQRAVYRLTLSSYQQPALPVDNVTPIRTPKPRKGGPHHPPNRVEKHPPNGKLGGC